MCTIQVKRANNPLIFDAFLIAARANALSTDRCKAEVLGIQEKGCDNRIDEVIVDVAL